jgi:phosphohistidine phosphatase
MAAQLWLLRHGEAVAHDAAQVDADRPLTPRGEEQARAAGQALRALGVRFQAAFTSPKVRARETARLACAALDVEPAVHEPLRAGFDGRDALELLAQGNGSARVLVVGHEPDLSQTVADLTGARVELKKGGVAAVRDGELIVLVRPRELARIAVAPAVAHGDAAQRS